MLRRSDSRSRCGAALTVILILASCGSDSGGPLADAPESSTAVPEDPGAVDSADSSPVDSEEPASQGSVAEVADGEPIRIGVQNLEGDPNGSFPEYSAGLQAAADYINAELGGLGGRQIEIELCVSVVTPDDSQRCANELSASGVELAVSTLNFFGNHFSIYQGADIPVIVGTPITLADFTSESAFAIGAGGGCLGGFTGIVEFLTNEIEELEDVDVQKVSVPWSDTPPGVVCYNDLQAKPLDVLNGTEPGSSERAGSIPDLTYLGVPIAPATADVTPQATEALEFEPDVITYTAQGADCWNFVEALGRLGWTPGDTPLVLGASCTDLDAFAAAGELADGVYVTSTENSVLVPLEGLEGQQLENATTYQTQGSAYGLSDDDLFKGFAAQGFSLMMNVWQIAEAVDGEVTGQAIADGLAATDGSVPAFGASPMDCANALEPYVSVCSSAISMNRWDGDQLVPVVDRLNGLDLVAGTELRPG